MHAVRRGAVAQLDLATDRGVDVRPAAARPAEEPAPFERRRAASAASIAATTRATSAWRTGMWSPVAVSRSSQPVSIVPARTSGRSSRSSRNDLLVVPPRTITIIWLERAVQPGQRLVAVAAGGDHLGDHRVELGRDHVALGDAGVDPDARPDRQDHRLDRARRRGEVALRVLGVEAGLDRVAVGRRRVALEATAGRDVELQLDEVESGRQLGDRMLDLEPGVHLEERELLLLRLVEELDRAGVRVAGERGEAARRRRGGRGPARA